MTPAEAAWVRENAWLPSMRRRLWGAVDGYTYDAEAGFATCACMSGICWHCAQGEHQFCDRKRIAPRPEWWLTNRPLNYIPPTAVWHGDRACRSLCPCCPDGSTRRARSDASPVTTGTLQLSLFEEVA